jgi:hypothetical protein
VALALWLICVGLCDLLRATRDATTPRRRALVVAVGLVLLVVSGLAVGLSATWWVTIGIVWGLGLAAWVVTSSLALGQPSAHRARWRAAAFVAFTVPFAALLLVGDEVRPAQAESSVPLVAQLGLVPTLVLCGATLLQLSTGNLLVRLLLDAVGVPAETNEKDLKGGRLLGPMERLFILVLAAAGELTAASVVVAAKGLLRWPELRSKQEQGPSDLSEYFLIGSFASWLLALCGWLLVEVL